MESWSQRINGFFKKYPVPWSVIESYTGDTSDKNYGYPIVDLNGFTVMVIKGEERDIHDLVDYVNFQAGRGH